MGEGQMPNPTEDPFQRGTISSLRVPIPATLRMALTLGLGPAVQLHLAKGAEVNGRDDKGQTPLILAASRGHRAICAMLLAAGADPELKDDAGFDALQVAVRLQREDVASLLRQHLQFWQAASSIGEPVDEIELAAWQPEPEPEAPPADWSVRPDLQAIQAAFSMHVPVDLDEDWSDVEIDLPALIARRGRRDRDEETRWLVEARRVMGIGLLHGVVREGLIGAIGLIGERPDHDVAIDHGALLRIVLGDLGIRVVDDADFAEETPEPDEDAEGELQSDLAEGMAFLRSLIGPGSDPLDPYFKALSRTKPLLREEEGAIARSMEQGMLRAFVAVTRSSPAMAKIIATVDAIERGKVSWRDAFAEDPAYGEHSATADEPRDEEDQEPNNAAEEVGAQPVAVHLPPVLAERLAVIRSLCTQLDQAAEASATDRTHLNLGRCLLVLRLKSALLADVRAALDQEDQDQTICEAFAAGVAEARDARLLLFHANQKFVLWMARRYQGFP
jgi:RNA polymerase primary sigma factor